MALAALLTDNGAMKQNLNVFDIRNLKPWQRQGLIILGAIFGSVAVYSLLRWLEQRRQAKVESDQEVGGA